MSHTNQTPNYHLPQFIGTDKPAWLVDFNQSMSDIDTQMKANETASATAEANAQSALSGLTATNAQVSGLQTDVSAIQTQLPLDEAQIATNTQNISTQASAIVNANNRIDTANGNITALNTKVGDLTDLNTTDKTSVVNAVNELNADFDNKVGFIGSTAGEYANMMGGGSFTATKNCWITLSSNTTVGIAINGIYVVGFDSSAGSGMRTSLPLRKGDVVTTNMTSGQYAVTYCIIDMVY